MVMAEPFAARWVQELLLEILALALTSVTCLARNNLEPKSFASDSVAYNPLSYNNQASFGDIYANAGIQYKIDVSQKLLLRLGAYGNLKHNINAQDDIFETDLCFYPAGDQRLDECVF